MDMEIARVRAEIERLCRTARWRHPSAVSALVWRYLGSGTELAWFGGRLGPGPAGVADPPWDTEELLAKRSPLSAVGHRDLAARIDALLPAPRRMLEGLHASDFAPFSQMPVLQIPFGAAPAELAGALLACRVLSACAPLVVDPASAPFRASSLRVSAGLYAVCALVLQRRLRDRVLAAAPVIVAETPRAITSIFVDPDFFDEGVVE